MISEQQFIKENLQDTPPVPCEFKVGDLVTFTNDYDLKFENRKIIGFAKDDSFQGRFIHLSKGAFWFPYKPESLKLESNKS